MVLVVLTVELIGNIPIVPAESGQAAMEAWNSTTWSDNILETYISPRQIMACAGPRLWSKCQSEGNRTGCCHTLQWKHETLARNWHSKIPKLLGKIRQLWSSLFAWLQHQSLRSDWYHVSFDFLWFRFWRRYRYGVYFFAGLWLRSFNERVAGIESYNYNSFCICFLARLFLFKA